MSTYRIYGITNYGTGNDVYTLIASGTGSVDANFDISGYSGFAIETGNHMAFNKILLDGKALYTDVNNALEGNNLDIDISFLESNKLTFPKIFQAKDDLYLTDNDMTDMGVELGAVLTFTTRSASSLSIALDAFDFDGTSGDDVIVGNAMDNDITPGGGSDLIDGLSGYDRVIYSGNKADYLVEVSFDDGTYTVEDLNSGGQLDTLSNIEQLVFDDDVVGLAVPLAPTKPGGTIYTGSDLSDWIVSGAGNDKINAGNGNNIIRAGDGNNTVVAGSGSDWIKAGAGNHKIAAGDGNNQIEISSGNSKITSGSGNDEINVASGNYKIDAGEGNNEIFIDALVSGKNSVVSGAGDDLVHIDGLSTNKINVGDGNNEIVMQGGGTINSGAGDDYIEAFGGSKVNAGGGDNAVYLGWSGESAKYTVQCGDGADLISVTSTLGSAIKSGAGSDRVAVTTILGKNKIDLGADLDEDNLYLVYDLFEGNAVLNTVSNFNIGDRVEICPGAGVDGHSDLVIDTFQTGAKLKPDNSGADIYFDTTGGKLYYDSDGAGAAAAVQIAVFKGTGLSNAEVSLEDGHLYITSTLLGA